VQGKRDQELLRIDARHDGRGNPYYWIAFGRGGIAGAAPGSDLAALNENRIAVTPLRLDLTDEPFLTKLAEVLARVRARVALSPTGRQARPSGGRY